MRTSTMPARQRGVALIMAVLIVALATILAISFASEGYMDQRRTSTVMVMDQAYEVALGAEALAAQVLSEDKNPKVDSLDEDWARRAPPMPIDNGVGEFEGNLEDLQGRFNLNNLLNSDGSRSDEAVHQFQRLLDLLTIDTKYATLMLDWIDADSTPDLAGGAEDATYAGQSPPYLTANMPITRTSELMSIVGMKQEDFARLEPYVSALPVGTNLNVCTASSKVLNSLNSTQEEWNDTLLAKERASGCFPKITDIDRAWGSQNDPIFSKIKARQTATLAETTNYFRANILVTIGTTELALYSVLNRVSTGTNAKTRVIQRSIGTT